MTGSYMVILTAFLADNGKNLPLATGAHRRLLAAVGRYRGTADRLVPAPPPGPEPAAGPAPAAGTADPWACAMPGNGTGLISNSHLASTLAARCNPRTPTRRKEDTGMAHHDRTASHVSFCEFRPGRGCSWRGYWRGWHCGPRLAV